MSFINELRRRDVLRVAAAYIVTSWLIIQVVETVLPAYGLEHHVRTVITLLAIGFVPAIILAWALEWTPAGIRRDTGTADDDSGELARADRKFDRGIIVVLTIALSWFVYDKLVPPTPDVAYSVAVLPFANETPNQLPDYLAEGLSGELLDLLGESPDLLVIARSSAFKFEGRSTDLAGVGRKLGVTHILAGGVGQIGDQLEVRARLLDADSGASVWAGTFTGRLNEVISIQNEIVADVLHGLGLTHAPSLSTTQPLSTPEAFALMLQAKQMFYDLDRSEEERAAAMTPLLQQVLEIDPDYTPALEWLLTVNWMNMKNGLMTPEEESRQKASIAARILAVEPDNVHVHSRFGYDALVEGEFEAAAASFTRALHSAPNNAWALGSATLLPLYVGRFDDAVALIRRSAAIDPLCSYCLYYNSKVLMFAGRLDEALASRKRFIDLHGGGHYHYGVMHLLRGEPQKAIDIFRDIKFDAQRQAGLAMAYHDLGRDAESREQLAALVEHTGDAEAEILAEVHAWRGEADAALDYLDGAELPFHRALEYFVNPIYRKMHDHPRWAAMRDEAGLSEARLANLEFRLPPQLRETG